MGNQNDDDMTRVTVRLPRKLLEALRKLAKEDGRSVNAEVVWLMAAAIRAAREEEVHA